MEDCSHLLPGDPVTCLVPTSQEAGNQRHDNSLAMTAPGTPPASPVRWPSPGEDVTHEPPDMGTLSQPRSVTIGPDGARDVPDQADRSDPYGARDGSGWAGRPLLRMGAWNDMGGGPAPGRR